MTDVRISARNENASITVSNDGGYARFTMTTEELLSAIDEFNKDSYSDDVDKFALERVLARLDYFFDTHEDVTESQYIAVKELLNRIL